MQANTVRLTKTQVLVITYINILSASVITEEQK